MRRGLAKLQFNKSREALSEREEVHAGIGHRWALCQGKREAGGRFVRLNIADYGRYTG